MDEITLSVPDQLLQSLPEGSDDQLRDMERAVDGWQTRLDQLFADREPDESVGAVVDLLERFEDRWERYDEFVVELRAWGQSPIYAMAWRDLHASLVRQLYAHDDLADRLDRERHARIFDNGIRQR